MERSSIGPWVIPIALLAAVIAGGLLWFVPSKSRDGNDSSSKNASATQWVVDPDDPGPSTPPQGRSLFDFLTTDSQGHQTVAFPFAALLKRIENELERDRGQTSPLKRVLIPLGRSLQRSVAAPEFFEYPRAVVAAVSEPRVKDNQSGLLLKDRLYLGYQERANLIEVISYNEEAGRFEFQVVRDYRPGGKPEVLYANRGLCMACHPNQAPIFSRQLWDETQANPKIASLLRDQRRDFYGVPLDQGVDIPNAIDDATDRANRFSLAQLFWREGCEGKWSKEESIQCRAKLFAWVLQYRLTGKRSFDFRKMLGAKDDLFAKLMKSWREKWPAGLWIPDADIPNRNPLSRTAFDGDYQALRASLKREGQGSVDDLLALAEVWAPFDPLSPRPPIERWPSDMAGREVEFIVSGLSDFLAEADIRRLDSHLAHDWMKAKSYEEQSSCEFFWSPRVDGLELVKFRCGALDLKPKAETQALSLEGRLYVKADKVVDGTITRLMGGDGDVLSNVAVGGKVRHDDPGLDVFPRSVGLHARLASGFAIKSIQLSWTKLGSTGGAPVPGRAKITFVDDFSSVERAVAEMAGLTDRGALDVFASKPFRRAAVMKALYERLGMPALEWCCVDKKRMPEVKLDGDFHGDHPNKLDEIKRGPAAVQAFYRNCGGCHEMPDRSPPNFLYGPLPEVAANVAHCAERIFFRLSMWRFSPQERLKTPMPPIGNFLKASSQGGVEPAQIAVLKDYVGELLQSQTGRPTRTEELLTRGYSTLRSCLPDTVN